MSPQPESDLDADRADQPAATDSGRLEGRARTVLESITDPFYLLDDQWRFVYINQRALDYVGMPREAVVGRVLWEIFPMTAGTLFSEQFPLAVREGRTAEFETTSPLTGRVVEVRAYPSIEGLSVSFRDVTERRRAEARDRLLVRLDDEMRALTDPDAIARTAAHLLGEHLGADRCSYSDAAASGNALEVIGDFCHQVDSIVGRYELSTFGEAFERSARSGEPFVVEDTETDPRTQDVREVYRGLDVRSMIGVPLLKAGQFVGGISVHQKTPRVWQPHEVDLVAAVANRCWESLDRARLTRSLLRKTRAFSVLADNATRLLSAEHPQALIDSLFHEASELANVEVCVHFLLTEDRTRLHLAAQYGLPPGAASPGDHFALDETMCGGSVAAAGPILRTFVQNCADADAVRLRELGVRAYVCYPLVYGGTVLGTLSFGTLRRDTLERDELEFLQALSDQVAAAYGRSRSEAALRESEERLLQAAAIAGLGTFDTNFGTAEMAVNAPGRAIYGWDAETRLSFAHAEAQFHPDDRQRVVDVVRTAFDEPGAHAFHIEHRIIRTDGVVRWIRVRGRAMFEHTGGGRRATRCLGTFVDITDRKEADERRERMLRDERAAREEAERVGRLKDEFLATVSHELRTPLNAILGWSQLLRRRPVGAPETQAAIEVIDRNARAQAQLIDDLLDMSRFVSGTIRVEMRHIDFALVVATAVESLQPGAEAKRIHLTQSLQTDGATVFGDAARLQQVVWNLLSNSLKFTPPGGRIDVRLERIGSQIDLTVSDTGSGIQPEFLPHIFDRFRQQDASTTRRHGGVGLGLSIVKQLVEIHGGDVRATSAGESLGSTFVVSLPVSHTWQPAATTEDSAGDAATLAGVRILLVDDEPDALTLMARILEDAGATVVSSLSGREAIDQLRGQPFDVLVSDIGMPDIDGYELIRQLRSSGEATRALPAIALTAYARAEDGMRARDAGFQRHVAKPIDVQEFVAAVAQLAPGRSANG